MYIFILRLYFKLGSSAAKKSAGLTLVSEHFWYRHYSVITASEFLNYSTIAKMSFSERINTSSPSSFSVLTP
jgi:hypothetical protein